MAVKHPTRRTPWFAVSFALAVAVTCAPRAHAASCCGGGTASALVLPKAGRAMVDLSMAGEHYDGLWRADGNWAPDPPGSDLNQYRVNAGFGYRLGGRWQASVALPLVWNSNRYSGLSSDTYGPGDATLGFWYETFDNAMCVYKVRQPADLMPAIYLGTALTVPIGVSPYDDVRDNFDITGRGFYRLDANLLVDKTVYPWTASLQLSHGRYLSRPVNREFGTYVEPYDKQLGARTTGSVSVGYVWFLRSLAELTTTLAYNDLYEDKATITGHPDPASGFRRRALATTVAWANMKKDWVVKTTWSHALKADAWGRNYPTTDIVTLGVSHVFE